jgi:hypothetical protein
MERLESEWTEYPVLRLDLNAEVYDGMSGIRAIADLHLQRWEQQYPPPIRVETPAGRFALVIEQAHKQTGKRVCVIIDEYDKPLLSTIGNPELHESYNVELLKKTDTDLREIDGIELPARDFADYRADPDRPVPVIYQSGYLTIKSYDPSLRFYTLGYPNAEVKNGFLGFLLPDYTGQSRDRGGFHIGMFSKELRAGDVDGFMRRLTCFFESIPYDLNDETERHYHVVFYLVFKLLGQYIDSEVKSAKGRSDAVVGTPDGIYVFEFKLDGTAEEALAQIDDRGYLVPYTAKTRKKQKLYKVGVEFDKEARNIGRWITREG